MLRALCKNGHKQVELQQRKRYECLYGCRLLVERTAVRHAAHLPLLMKELALVRWSWRLEVVVRCKAAEW